MAKLSRSEIVPGDHIYTMPMLEKGRLIGDSEGSARDHIHHGIYVALNRVVHFSLQMTNGRRTISNLLDPCEECNFRYTGGGVVLTCLDCFLLQGELYRYEYGVSGKRRISTTARSDSPANVTCRAMLLVRTGGYSQPANCENFALYCKTGKHFATGQINAPLLEVDKLSRSEIVPGDHIFTWKSGSGHDHDHHGIYVAENQVVHFSLQRKSCASPPHIPCEECGFHLGHGVVVSCLDCFRLGGDIYRYEYGVYGKKGASTPTPSESPEEGIRRAIDLCQHGFGGYDDPSNCEKFAFFCRTGRPFLPIENETSIGRTLGISVLVAGAVGFIIRAMR